MAIRKLAVFVEGQTEQIFVAKLVGEIASQNKLVVISQKFSGPRHRRIPVTISSQAPDTNTDYMVAIFDCCGDSMVLSDMLRQVSSLESNGYGMVLGLRDIYPESLANIPAMRQAISRALSVGSRDLTIPINLHLAQMEMEAWFIAEHSHFNRTLPPISPALIQRRLGYDVESIDYELIPHPADELKQIRQLVGLGYNKNRRVVDSIVESLNYDELFLNTRGAVPCLDGFLNDLDNFFH